MYLAIRAQSFFTSSVRTVRRFGIIDTIAWTSLLAAAIISCARTQ
jgi:hypothetical protein